MYHLDNKLSLPRSSELIISDKSTEMAEKSSFVDGFFREEVVDSLNKHADLEKFTRDIAQCKIISQDVKKCFDSLDPPVPRPLQIRYLLLHAKKRLEKGNPKLCECWLKLLAQYGVPSQLLLRSRTEAQSLTGSDSLVEQHDSLVTGDGATNFSISKKRPSGGYFLERHISDLTEVLAGYSGQWENIAISLNLPTVVCKNIMARIHMHDIKVCLSDVLREWIIGEHEYALAPSMENLKKVLGSELVGLGKVAGQLEKNLSKRGVCIVGSADPSIIVNVSCLDEVGLDSSEAPLIEITCQPVDTVVPEEKSTLLEVQVDCEPFHTISYQWIKDGGPLHDDAHYDGASEQILCIKNASLISKGTYSCKIMFTTSSNQSLSIESALIDITIELPFVKRFLVDMYSGRPIVKRDSWHKSNDMAYNNLALIKMGEIDLSNRYVRSTIQGNMDDILYEKENIGYMKAFGTHRKDSLVLIEGRPGSGKTTLVHKISNDWSTGNPILVGANLLFLVSLRLLSKMNRNIGMADILRLFYHNEALARKALEHIQNCNGEGVCFILDGLDEYSEKDSESIIFQLINKVYLPLSMVIVASRPIATAELRLECKMRLEVLGFLKEEIFKYVEHYFSSASGSAESMKSFLSEHPNILQMCYLPVHATMVCFLHDRMGGSLPHTETGIYQHFVRLTLQRNTNQNFTVSEKPWSIDSLPSYTKLFFDNICELAFHMTISHEQIFAEERLSFSDEVPVDDPAHGLVTIDFVSGLYGFQKLYTFAHLTFQEYLAAYHIASLDEKKQMEVMREYGKERHMEVVWKFFCGLTSFKDLDPIFSQVCEFSDELLFHCQCAFESQQPTTYTSIVLKHDGVFDFRWCTLKPSDLACIGYVISNADSYVSILWLSHCGISDCDAEILCSTLKSCPKLSMLTLGSNKIGDNGAQCLAKVLETCIELRELHLDYNEISDDGVIGLAKGLQNCVGLRELHLNNNQFSDSGAKSLGSSLSSCVKCSYLHLENNQIGDDGVKGLAEGLRTCVELRELHLNNNQISDSGAESLGSALSNHAELHELHLENNQIGDDGVKGLAEGLRTCVELWGLHLNNNQISDSGAESLGSALSSCVEFHYLHLENNQIGDDGVKGLAEGLGTCVELSTLHLNNNQISDSGAESLGSALSNHAELHGLHLENNQIGDDGVKGLAEGLRTCVKLWELHLNNNQISDSGAESLGSALSSCVEFRYLHLKNNQIGDDGVKGLAEGLRTCVKLWGLHLNNNQISDSGAESLGSALSNHAELHELHLENNQIGDDGVKGLAEGLRTCVELWGLHLNNNQISDSGAKSLGSALSSCVKCSYLYLENNQIGDDGVKGLAEGLRTCVELSTLHLNNNQISDSGAESLGSALSNHAELHELHLENNQIGDDGVKGLAEGLRTCVELWGLHLNNNQISDSGAKSLCSALSSCVKCSYLYLENNQIGDDGVKGLAEGLRTCVELRELHLNNNQISDSGAESLGSALSNHAKLHELHLENNQIGDDGVKGLAEGLRTCVELWGLHLNNNQISDSGAESLGSALSSCVEFHYLHLENNQIGDDGVKGLAEGLRTCVELRRLHLNNNQISDSGAESLGSALSSCVKCSYLYLENNQIGDDGVKGLAEGLRTCVKLWELHLNNNQISDSGAESLGSALSNHAELYKLHLENNQIGDDGVKGLAEGLRTCVQLWWLHLNNNQISDSGAESLGSALSSCVEFRYLHLKNNQIGDDGMKGLAEGLRTCVELRELHLSYNQISHKCAESICLSLSNCTKLDELRLEKQCKATS